MLDPRLRGPAVVTVGATVALAGTFLPWLRSGTRNRSSYAIFELVERLGFAPDGAMAWALRLWPVVPLLLVLSAVSQWLHPLRPRGRRALAFAPAVTVVYAGATAVAVLTAPDAALFRVGPGPTVVLGGCAAMAAGTLVGTVTSGRSAARAAS